MWGLGSTNHYGQNELQGYTIQPREYGQYVIITKNGIYNL